MKNSLVIIVVGVITLNSCSTARQGIVKQGPDGKIISASIVAKCSPPAKAYSKDLSAKVKAEIDSLQQVPKSIFDLAFEQKVVKLREYSPRGLDMDLLTFRICEMANNRGLTSEQTSSLIDKAIGIWSGTNTLTQTVTSNNQSGGITAGIVVVPEDKEIPLENNFTVIEKVIDAKNAFEIKPRQGVWYNTFVAWPLAEDSLVKGHVSNRLPVQSGSWGEGVITHKGEQVSVKMSTITQSNTNPDMPIYFYFDKRPSVIFFGDAVNPRKQYFANPVQK